MNIINRLKYVWKRMAGVTEDDVLAILAGEAEIARGEYVVVALPVASNTTSSGTSVTLYADCRR